MSSNEVDLIKHGIGGLDILLTFMFVVLPIGLIVGVLLTAGLKRDDPSSLLLSKLFAQ
jgi:hypothetical protein